jgi:HEAT repeat protein
MDALVEQMNSAPPFVNDPESFRDEFDEARRRFIESETVDERIAAVKTLGDFKSDLTTAHLVGALFDDDLNVRQAAIEALNRLGDPDISSECLEVMFGTALVPDESFATDGVSFDGQTERKEMSLQEALSVIETNFDDPSPEVRNAAIIALRDLDPDDTVNLIERILESSSPDRRRRITEAIEHSGLAMQVIEELAECDPRRAQISLSLLFLIAKLEIHQPFVQAIENHDSAVIRRALIKVLTSSGHGRLAESAAKRRLGISRNAPDAYACR